MTTSTLRDDVAAFAAAVRAHLADLPGDEIDDLTDGLEADLLDQAEEAGAFAAGDPERYAAELRASAGLPERPDPSAAASLWSGIADGSRRLRAEAAALVRSTWAGAATADLLLSLRPVWWLFRGWVVALVVQTLVTGWPHPVPLGPAGWAFLAAVVVVSVQWGRGRWAPGRLLRGLRILVSVGAVVAAPFAIGALLSVLGGPGDVSDEPAPQGLTQNGKTVTNIFGYDAEGRPLTDIQLFDQDGDPLLTVPGDAAGVDADYGTTDGGALVPFAKTSTGYVWNVFPLREAPVGEDGQADPGAAREATPPFATTNPVTGYRPATPAPTPAPRATDVPAPTPAPTP